MTQRDTDRALTDAPQQFAAPWGAHGYISELGGGPVHWVSFAGDATTATRTPMVFVHGLGGSHLNWAPVGKLLGADRPAYALDLAGFGLTPGTGRSTSVRANATLLDTFIRETIGRPVILVGNSMGGAVAALYAAAHPDTVDGLVLIDPSLPLPRRPIDPGVFAMFAAYALPGVGELVLRTSDRMFSPRQNVERIINLCFADRRRADPTLMTAAAALFEERSTFAGTERWFLQAARSLLVMMARRQSFWQMLADLPMPVLLIHGERDRLVSIHAARVAAARLPEWDTLFLPQVGHTPQLERPDVVADGITDWLARRT
jgi:pimeloyl-ACP methyl ester carboxylesterase